MPTTSTNPHRILVLGAGNFGTCLGQYLAQQGYNVTLMDRCAEIVRGINETHKNPKYLSTITLSNRIQATDILDAPTVDACDILVLVVPTQDMRAALEGVRPYFRREMLVVCAAKGIEIGTLKLPSGVIGEVLGSDASRQAVFLSGPSFAEEIVRRLPTCVSVASRDAARCQLAQQVFHAAHFRAYTSEDPTGVEVAGALKNVIAIAAGASVGIGYERNSLAALVTRGLAEIMRIGVKLGANPLTFNGLSGVGDLFLTCTSEKSRNFSVGYRLGRGETLPEILRTVGSVTEGVATAKAAFELSRQLDVDAPIVSEVYQVLYEGKPITQAVLNLMTRDAKPEIILPA